MKNIKGFSLIELMIVIAVIGILTSFAVPAYQNYIKKAELGAALGSLQALKTNIEDHIATYGDFPSDDGSTNTGELSLVGSNVDAFRYGKLKAIQDATDNMAGAIEITFGENGSTLTGTETLALTRDKNGNWVCQVNANMENSIIPRGCSAKSS